MSVLVAASASAEGRAALAAGVTEAKLRDTELLWANVGADPVPDVEATVGDVPAREVHLDPRMDKIDALLDSVVPEQVSMIIVGMRPRSPVGKLLLGSMAQRVILESSVPVLAVKARTPR